MKQFLTGLIFTLLLCNTYAQQSNTNGITLLWIGNGGGYWQDSLNWIQIHVPAGERAVHRIPTEADDVIFSQSISGIDSVDLNVNSSPVDYSQVHPLEVGGIDSTGPRCRSIHISGTSLTLGPGGVDAGIIIDVFTRNGGHIIIDSASSLMYGQFQLHGGDSSVTDLVIENSNIGLIFSHAVWSLISLDSLAKVRLLGSKLGIWDLTSRSGGNFYAKDCLINSPDVHLGDNSVDTFLNSKIYVDGNAFVELGFFIGRNSHFVSSGVSIESFEQIYFTTSGSVLNGNVKCDYADGYFVFDQEDPLHPLPNIINGNLEVSENNEFPIKGNVKISGNFINHSFPMDYYLDSATIKINNKNIFLIGGLPNYGTSDSIIGCAQDYCHFSIEFFGDSDSYVRWPIGFPIDTLIINKVNCAKVTFANSVYVSGNAFIQGGQLELDPNDTIPYKMVCKGNLNILQGGGLFLRRDSTGAVANIAIGGSLYDYNTQSDTACAGFNNPYNGTVTLYNPTFHAKHDTISIAGNSQIGNFNLIGQDASAFILASDMSVNNFTFTNPGKFLLGDHHLTVAGSITGYGSKDYFVTNGNGALQLNRIGSAATIFPVGADTVSYDPATILNTGTQDNFSVSVTPHVLSGGTTGYAYTAGVVDRTWHIAESVPGSSNVSLTLQWNAADELRGFPRNTAYVAHYTSGSWNTGAQMSAVGAGPFTLTRSGITGFSPFAIMGPAGSLPVSLIDFYGEYAAKAITLKWHTADELNTSSFTLEKSFSQQAFTPIASIPAFVARGNNGYQYVDAGVFATVNYYRLKIRGADGNYIYSKTIAVAAPGSLFTAYPNPAKDQVFISLPISVAPGMLTITDAKGGVVKTVPAPAGVVTTSVNVSGLPAGLYSIILHAGNSTQSVRFVKQ